MIENVRILRGAPVGSFADHGLRCAFMAFWGALSSSTATDQSGGIDLDEWLA